MPKVNESSKQTYYYVPEPKPEPKECQMIRVYQYCADFINGGRNFGPDPQIVCPNGFRPIDARDGYIAASVDGFERKVERVRDYLASDKSIIKNQTVNVEIRNVPSTSTKE